MQMALSPAGALAASFTLSVPNITIIQPDVPFAPHPLPEPNPATHVDEIVDQFSRLTANTAWNLVTKIPFEGDLWEPEGIAKVGEDRFFVSAGEYTVRTEKYPNGEWVNGTDRTPGEGFGHIVVFDGQGKRIADATVSEKGSTEYHLGGIDYDGTYIWAQLAEYRPNSTSTVIRVDPCTLETEYVFRVADHQGGVVHNTATDTLTTLNWGGREGSLFSLNSNGGFAPLPKFTTPESRVTNPSHWVDYQDCKYLGYSKRYPDRAVMLASGIATLSGGVQVGGIAIVDAVTLVPLMEVPFMLRTENDRVLVTKNPVDVDVVDGKLRLYFLPEEHDSTLYVYEIDEPK